MELSEVAVVTCCTKRKRLGAGRFVTATAKRKESLEDFAERWADSVVRAERKFSALDLYVGRGFSEVRNAAVGVGADVFVVSAGLGLVSGSDSVPAYNLTVASGLGSILPWMRALQEPTDAWWTALTAAHGQDAPLAKLICARRGAGVLVALPSTYLELVKTDLSSLSAHQASSLRLFTSQRGRVWVPEHLQQYVMPYDDRLEGTVHAGTQADFAQRALAHFVTHIFEKRLSAAEAGAAVRSALRGATRPQLPSRAKKTDEQIAALLRKKWKNYGGGSTALLRYLRDEALVKCEQSRFRSIWRTVGEEYAA